MMAQRMVAKVMMGRQAAEVVMGRRMVRRRRRRCLLRDGVTGEAYGKRGRDGEGLGLGLPSAFVEEHIAPYSR